MTNTFRFSDEELQALKYAICQCMYRLEARIEETRFLELQNTAEVDLLEETLLTLECIHMELFEGGDN